MRPKDITLGSLAISLYLVAWAFDTGTGAPFTLVLWVILIFRYIAPAFFVLVGARYFIRITTAILKFQATAPLIVDVTHIIEGGARSQWTKPIGLYFYMIWAWYAVLYPILAWLILHRVGVYERINRAWAGLE
ncbi:MAG: hypothetical protein ACYS76_04500 [Planctomycetota bacterium]|jgi:hypothetical protein